MKLKDYVTLGNLFCGLGAMISLLHDHFTIACYLLFLGYLFDLADGFVARLTKQFDEFGGHLDTICDFISTSVNGSLISYYAFHFILGYPWWAAAIVGAFPLTMGTIRQARSMTEPRSYPCYWLGLPRPAAAFFIVSIFNSVLMDFGVFGHILAAVAVVISSTLHLSTYPFINHHDRSWNPWLKYPGILFVSMLPLSFVLGWVIFDRPEMVFDWMLGSLIIYFGGQWIQIPKLDFERIKTYVNGGDLVLPLVHKRYGWRSKTVLAYFEDVENPPHDVA